MGADQVLMKEYKKLEKEPWTKIELINDNIREWIVALFVLNPDSDYYGGYFRAKMSFKSDYPYSPPDFKFLRPLYHPNVYTDGRLCISILHPPGDDEMSGELASERWSPVQSVESVLISILSLLDDPEITSPANVDAAKVFRDDRPKFKEMVQKDRDASKADIPAGFEMPTHEDAFKQKKEEEYLMSWEDSDAEEEFDGSDWEMGEGDEEEEDTGSDNEDAEQGEDED